MLNNPSNAGIVITDTSCFILLDKLEAFWILHKLFSSVITTPEIAHEFGNGLPEWITIEQCSPAVKTQFQTFVDEGEASAIALASEIKCDYIVLDDMSARKFAQKLGLNVIGTIGILLMAKQQNAIPALKPYLHAIQQTNFRLSPALIDQFLKKAGE